MREELKKYYRTDLEEQRISNVAKGKRVFVRFFTDEGYAKLDELISQIKQGGSEATAAKEGLAKLVMPWAEWRIERFNAKNQAALDATNILHKTILQLETKPEVKDWSSFHIQFTAITKNAFLSDARKTSYIAKLDQGFAALEVVHSDPSEPLEQKEFRIATKQWIGTLSDRQRDIVRMYPAVEGKGNWQANVAKATGLPVGSEKDPPL
jgi:DNA-directed RNA polymerase specialized sigma24 family protein